MSDPVNRCDPAGLRWITDSELVALREEWDRGWWDKEGGYYVAAGALLGLSLLSATGVGGIVAVAIGGALIGGGASAAIQQYVDGRVDWGQVGADALKGAAAGATAFAAGAAIVQSVPMVMLGPFGRGALAAATTSLTGGATSRLLNGQDPLDPRYVTIDLALGSFGTIAGRMGCGQLFQNRHPESLEDDLWMARHFGVHPIQPRGPAFDELIQEQDEILFVVTWRGELLVGPGEIDRRTASGGISGGEITHAVLGNGKKVRTAGVASGVEGRFRVYRGEIVDDSSGHYRPSVRSLLTAQRAWRKYGVRFKYVFVDFGPTSQLPGAAPPAHVQP